MAVCLYQYLTRAIESKEPCAIDRTFFFECAKAIFKEGISLHKVLDTIDLMGRRIVLYLELQAQLVSDIEQQRTMGSHNRSILPFDNVFCLMAEKNGELLCRER